MMILEYTCDPPAGQGVSSRWFVSDHLPYPRACQVDLNVTTSTGVMLGNFGQILE
jgi:hypothetical protein